MILQSPLGDPDKKRYAESRVIRVLKLDVSRPLDAKVAGEYLALASPAIFLNDFGARNIGRHQIRRELNAAETEAKRAR